MGWFQLYFQGSLIFSLLVYGYTLPIQEKTLDSEGTFEESVPISVSEQVQVAEIVQDTIEVVSDDPSIQQEEEAEQHSEAPQLRTLRPGLTVTTYSLEIEPNGESFTGTLVVQVNLAQGTQEDPILLNAEDLNIQSVSFGITTIVNPMETDFFVDDGILEIMPPIFALSYFFLIRYEGRIRNDGTGLYRGFYDDGQSSYLAMNLYPTHARRVFPCVDEPEHTAALSLTVVNNYAYSQIVSNALNEGDSNVARFSPLSTATHLWGLVAHDFQNINYPGDRLRLFIRSGLGSTQHSYASIMSQALFLQLNEYTQKPYFEIDANAEEWLQIFAMPDITRDWMSLSSVGIWEPHILMNEVHAVYQQKTALVALASAYARQWFGYVIFPENWRYSWITKGLQLHAAYELAEVVDPEIDMNAVFVTDVIYESMYYDAYGESQALEPNEDLYDEVMIRDLLNGVMKYKAPAIMRMLKLVLGDNNDYIRSASIALLNGRSLQTVNPLQFHDAINSEWWNSGGNLIEEVAEFLDPWISNAGYPVINVATSTAGTTVIVTQERFSYTNSPNVIYNVPLTFATKINPNFDNIYPDLLLDSSGISFNVFLDEEDWIIFNLQGQGYYRVNYDFTLWERLIWSLEDPDQRFDIHPLNRAQLVDDALNLARAGRLDYDIAFQVVLTMEHETHYAVWKAFIRNMEFLRKRLVALDDEDYDWDIYRRMVRRSIVAVEREYGFSPEPLLNEDPMISMTRGLVMEHACRALYQPCVAAAIDWFYDPSGGEPSINPNIPADLRPAVFCTMVREGDAAVRDLLWAHYDNENVHWERIVILKALACSQDRDFILAYLQETTLSNTRFGTEERSIIFKAIAESSTENTDLAFRFLQANTFSIRTMYGGPDKLEEIIFFLAENVADFDQTNNFMNWIDSISNNLDDSVDIALRASRQAEENLVWNEVYLQAVYEWIDENDACGVTVSVALMLMGLVAALLNH